MIFLDTPCEKCKHIRPNIDGWLVNCDAFPDGLPEKFPGDKDVRKLKECNNGIGYEPKDKE